jgi:hypothetical protein
MTTLLRIAQEVCPRDAVVDPDLGAAQAGEVFHSHVSVSAIKAVCLLMTNSLDLETLMKVIPRRRFVGVDDLALGNAATDEWGGLAFGANPTSTIFNSPWLSNPGGAIDYLRSFKLLG